MGKPEGFNLEATALLLNSHPVVSRQPPKLAKIKQEDAAAAKPKPNKSVPVWQYKGFKNPARGDGLELRTWIKGFKDVNGRIKDADDGELYFARFNQKVQMYRYTPEEYERQIAADSGDWTRAETDYLMSMCERFDLRFTIIADRYEYPGGPRRSVEDLKERYYAIARKLLVVREGGESAVANHTIIRYPYSKAHESERKQGLDMLLRRTQQQVDADNAVMADCKAIEERRRASAPAAAAPAAAPGAAAAAGPSGNGAATQDSATQGAAAASTGANNGWSQPRPNAQTSDAELRHPAEFSNQTEPGVPSLFDAQLRPAKPPNPGVFFRSGCTTATAQALTNAITGPNAPRIQKAVEQTMLELGYGPLARPSVSTRAVCGAWLALRSEVIAYHESRKMGPPRPQVASDDKKKGKRRER